MKVLLVLLGLVLITSALRAPPNDHRKKLQGPPSDFPNFVIPSPQAAAVQSSSALIGATFSSDGQGGSVWQGSFPVDSDTQMTMTLLSPYLNDLQVNVQPPSSSKRFALHTFDAAAPPYTKSSGPFGIDGQTFPSTSYVFANPTVGVWNVELKLAKVIPYDTPKAALLIGNESPYQVVAHVNTRELQQGQEVGLVATLVDSTILTADGRAATVRAEKLVTKMEVVFPNGHEVFVDMHDDGFRGGDRVANDGTYGAVLSASQAGSYQAHAVFTGVTPQGRLFARTTEHLFSVAQPVLTLTGLSSAEVKSDNFVYFYVDVDLLSGAVDRAASDQGLTIKAYAEVWGTDSTGLEYVPVGWVQAMVDPQRDAEGENYITLQLHSDWVHKAGAQPPFQLRNAWVEDRDANVILSNRAVIYVEEENASLRRKFNPVSAVKLANFRVTEEMKVGPRPAALRNATALSGKRAAGGKLVLVHGYCASVNEFPTSQFKDSVQFTDYKQSRSNDDFALRIKAFGDQFPSFGIVAHSQGGLAALHLHTYYWSNLEVATGTNGASCALIQSVGSPYYGSGLAGSLAGIGDWFGVGCGKNTDLSYDGAESWASAIPVEPQKDVHYYTTQYGDDGYCVWGANLVLYKPNDGTTEIKKAALKGGVNEGTKNDWCHTSEMISPAQCTDPERNAKMDLAACR